MFILFQYEIIFVILQQIFQIDLLIKKIENLFCIILKQMFRALRSLPSSSCGGLGTFLSPRAFGLFRGPRPHPQFMKVPIQQTPFRFGLIHRLDSILKTGSVLRFSLILRFGSILRFALQCFCWVLLLHIWLNTQIWSQFRI